MTSDKTDWLREGRGGCKILPKLPTEPLELLMASGDRSSASSPPTPTPTPFVTYLTCHIPFFYLPAFWQNTPSSLAFPPRWPAKVWTASSSYPKACHFTLCSLAFIIHLPISIFWVFVTCKALVSHLPSRVDFPLVHHIVAVNWKLLSALAYKFLAPIWEHCPLASSAYCYA